MYKVVGSQQDGRVGPEKAVVRRAPFVTLERLAGVLKALIRDLRHPFLSRTPPQSTRP
jgi:hypothetical protein